MSYSQRIVTALAALVVCSAAACGSQTTEQAPTSTSPAPSSSSAKPAAPAAPTQRTAPAAPGSTVPMMPNPNGDGSVVPCEGTICTNPNHGAGEDPADNGGAVMPNPNGDGSVVPCEGTICTNPNHGAGDDGNG
jgi:hypothetical protein